MNVIIRNWNFEEHGFGTRLAGQIYGHPRFMDGEIVSTSTIVDADNQCFITRSGTHYECEPAPTEAQLSRFRKEQNA